MGEQALSRTSRACFLSRFVCKHYQKLACIYFKEYLPYVEKLVSLEISIELLSGVINEKNSTDYRGKRGFRRGMRP